MEGVKIRVGKKEDIHAVYLLIKELAMYEKLPDEVEITPEQLIKDGFGETPLYGLLVAEIENTIVGLVIYYFRYSTWKGKRLYIEDIIVTEKMRGNGIGKMLFDSTIMKAKELNCKGINWLVLDWNKPAINFYDKYGATYDATWTSASLSYEQVQKYQSFVQ